MMSTSESSNVLPADQALLETESGQPPVLNLDKRKREPDNAESFEVDINNTTMVVESLSLFPTGADPTSTPTTLPAPTTSIPENTEKPTRILCLGSFDLFHGGHALFLQKAKTIDNNVKVIVGLYSDDTIRGKLKEPVFDEMERLEILKGNKFVDEIHTDAPGSVTKEYLDKLECKYALTSLSINGIARGSSETFQTIYTSGGAHDLKMIRKDSRFDTSNILLRILSREKRDENNNTLSGIKWDTYYKSKNIDASAFLSSKDVSRIKGSEPLKPIGKVIYIAGSFDLFNSSHVTLLKKAKSMGDYLLVGLHGDSTVKEYTGEGFPVMKYEERLLPLLSCKYVNDVLINAPLTISEAFLKEYPSAIVVQYEGDIFTTNLKEDPYKIPKVKGCFEELSMICSEDEDNILEPNVMKLLDPKVILERVHPNWANHMAEMSPL